MKPIEQDLRSPPSLGSAAIPPDRGFPQAPLAGSMWFLSGRSGEGEPIRLIPINCSHFKIGRRTACDLQLKCPTVSSLHAEFIDKGSTAVLRDLGSTNGTFVNGKRLTSAVELTSGDLIQFAAQTFRVVKQKLSANRATARENVCQHALASWRSTGSFRKKQ